MYSKQEASLLRKKFWETAGQYFAPMPSAGFDKVNWVNYKTGIRYVNFRLQADERMASIAIELSHPDPVKRNRFFNYFMGLKNELPSDWIWEEETPPGVNRIFRKLEDVNIYRTESWPSMISFFKQALVLLDAFWFEYKDMFEMID